MLVGINLVHGGVVICELYGRSEEGGVDQVSLSSPPAPSPSLSDPGPDRKTEFPLPGTPELPLALKLPERGAVVGAIGNVCGCRYVAELEKLSLDVWSPDGRSPWPPTPETAQSPNHMFLHFHFEFQ